MAKLFTAALEDTSDFTSTVTDGGTITATKITGWKTPYLTLTGDNTDEISLTKDLGEDCTSIYARVTIRIPEDWTWINCYWIYLLDSGDAIKGKVFISAARAIWGYVWNGSTYSGFSAGALGAYGNFMEILIDWQQGSDHSANQGWMSVGGQTGSRTGMDRISNSDDTIRKIKFGSLSADFPAKSLELHGMEVWNERPRELVETAMSASDGIYREGVAGIIEIEALSSCDTVTKVEIKEGAGAYDDITVAGTDGTREDAKPVVAELVETTLFDVADGTYDGCMVFPFGPGGANNPPSQILRQLESGTYAHLNDFPAWLSIDETGAASGEYVLQPFYVRQTYEPTAGLYRVGIPGSEIGFGQHTIKLTLSPDYCDTDNGGTTDSAGHNPDGSFGPNKAIDHTETTKWLVENNDVWPVWWQYSLSVEFGAVAATSYKIQASTDSTRNPKDWTFEGSNDPGSGWDTLDTITGETGWSNYEWRTFDFANVTAYLHYRIVITDNTDSTVKIEFAELGIFDDDVLEYEQTFYAHAKSKGPYSEIWNTGQDLLVGFDDGRREHPCSLFNIFDGRDLRVRPTFFVIAGQADGPLSPSWRIWDRLRRAGCNIACHYWDVTAFSAESSDAEALRKVDVSRELMLSQNFSPFQFVPPGGGYTGPVASLLSDCLERFSICRTSSVAAHNDLPIDPTATVNAKSVYNDTYADAETAISTLIAAAASDSKIVITFHAIGPAVSTNTTTLLINEILDEAISEGMGLFSLGRILGGQMCPRRRAI